MPLDEYTLNRHMNGIFIETGAGPCNGSKLAVKLGFKRIIVIEFDPGIYKQVKERFQDVPQVEVIFGDSGKVLGPIIQGIEEPITFWLDAHGKSCDTSGCLAEKPLLRELEAIAHHPLRLEHTILIDDWDVVDHPRRAPHLNPENVREALAKVNPDFRLSRVDGLLHEKRAPCFMVLVAEPKKEHVSCGS